MLLVALGWGAFGGAIAALVVLAACESVSGQGLPWGRKRRLIESGYLCECGHGAWMHGVEIEQFGDNRGEVVDERLKCKECECRGFIPRVARVPAAKQVQPPEMYRRLMSEKEGV